MPPALPLFVGMALSLVTPLLGIRKDSQLPALLLVHSSPKTGHLRRGGHCDTPGDIPPLPQATLPVPRAGLAEPCPCLSPDSVGGPGTSRGIEGVARQVGAGVTSGAITSDFSLQPEELQSTEIPGQHLPSRLFWAEDGLVCFCSCSPDAINKELAKDKYSEAVNALCICSAFKICAWPVSIYCLDTRLRAPSPQQTPAALQPASRGCADTALGAMGGPLGAASP